LNPIDLQPITNPEAFAFEMLRPEDNLANIDQNYIETLKTLSFRARMRYWKGMWLEDVPGALWTSDRIEKNRVASMPETRDRVTVGVDPAVSQGEKANLTGIVTVARSKGHLFIGRDSSLNGSPFAWGSRAVEDYYDMEADIMVGEVNQGGDLVQSNVWSIDKDIRFKKVHATRGKAVRAEPVANLCEQGKLHVVGQLTDLENEMTGFVPGETDFSPNRLDAMVWAAWELMEKKVQVRSI
jgi:phage terminase large subunit-like protein